MDYLLNTGGFSFKLVDFPNLKNILKTFQNI